MSAPRWAMRAYIKRLLVTWQHPENTLFDDGAILVNSRGERFCNERQWPDRELAVARQPGKIGFIVLDGRLIERYSKWPHFISTRQTSPMPMRPITCAYGRTSVTAPSRSKNWLLAAGLDRARCNLQSLPSTTMSPANRLIATAERAINTRYEPGDWLLLGPVKAYFTTTEGGAAINRVSPSWMRRAGQLRGSMRWARMASAA